MARRKYIVLFGVLAFAILASAGGWIASMRIESPSDAAARAAPPVPSPILVPVEKKVLSSVVVTRGTARFGLPQPITIAHSILKPDQGLIAALPLRNTQFAEGDAMLVASGRPVFVLRGKAPAYRDLAPRVSGDDVRQLEEGLQRLGFAPGAADGHYDQQTSAAVADWYKSRGWEPFGPTPDQLAGVRALEIDWGEAEKRRLTTAAAASAAVLQVETARADAERKTRAAAAELEAKIVERQRLMPDGASGASLAVDSARATAEHNNRAAAAELTASIADRALVVLDPRQPQTARELAEARLEVARAAVEKTRLEGERAVRDAEREHLLSAELLRMAEAAIESAQAGVQSARQEGDMAIQAALDAREISALDAKLAAERAVELRTDLDKARRKLGIQVPADEIVFIPALPVRVEEVFAAVGDAARGPVLSVTDNQLMIDSSLPLDAAPLIKPGMRVDVDEQALGVEATGTVDFVATTPGTRGVDGYHIYFEVRVEETTSQLEGFSVRLKIPIESTKGAVIAVPLSALSLSADGKSRVQVKTNDALEFVVVEPGLSADGYVEVTAVNGELAPGQLVVVGYDNPK